MLPFNNPSELVEKLKDYVVGQDKVLTSVALYFFKHCLSFDYGLDITSKPVLLLTGSTGIGKTFIIKKACELMNFRMAQINAKSICQEGWHGTSFIGLLQTEIKKLKALSGDRICVFIDEFDKICIPQGSSTDKNTNEHMQYSLLKYLEGMDKEAYVDEDKSFVKYKQLCFVLAGNFQALRDERTEKTYIGFNQESDIIDLDICQELIRFGMVPEIAGRVSEILELKSFDKEQYLKLWSNKNFFINEWLSLLGQLGAEINIEDLMNNCVETAVKKNVGVRGLIQEANKVINDILINSPQVFNNYTLESINAELVFNKCEKKL